MIIVSSGRSVVRIDEWLRWQLLIVCDGRWVRDRQKSGTWRLQQRWTIDAYERISGSGSAGTAWNVGGGRSITSASRAKWWGSRWIAASRISAKKKTTKIFRIFGNQISVDYYLEKPDEYPGDRSRSRGPILNSSSGLPKNSSRRSAGRRLLLLSRYRVVPRLCI